MRGFFETGIGEDSGYALREVSLIFEYFAGSLSYLSTMTTLPRFVTMLNQ